MSRASRQTAIDSVHAEAYRVATEQPEADGTLCWDATTIVVAHIRCGDIQGLGYSYTDASAAGLIRTMLAPLLRGEDAMALPALWQRMVAAVRNIGRPGLASCAIAAVDTALWDLKARLLGQSLLRLLGAVREAVPVYGSGGFTNYEPSRLSAQVRDWQAAGIARFKIKVGSDPAADAGRVAALRQAIGDKPELMVDANGAYTRKQALALAWRFADSQVSWFEEPVSSDDLEGLRLLRDRAPPGMEIAAGEYGYDLVYFRRMLAAGAVDVLQADITRCGGLSELLRIAALCQAHGLPLSTHTAPALHLHACCALPGLRHLEYFHDHVRLERMLFDGVQQPRRGLLYPDLERHGHGLSLNRERAAEFLVKAA